MNLITLNTLLFAGKWVLIGLVYLVLVVIVITVRREMISHNSPTESSIAMAAGYLRVIKSGSDSHVLPGKILPLKPETRLGAERDNDLILHDQFVSRHHARLRWDGMVWWVEDIGSSNGTSINGQRCLPGIPQSMTGGANLQIGDMIFELIV
ncbi:MAG TPA: FHA domain-containing protein [Anaerolineaceae bacterium]|nr:FHA domain-containing protein [Anaerolineaceae bacterium]